MIKRHKANYLVAVTVAFAACPAFASGPLKFTVSQPDDPQMSCEQLWDEAFAMRAIIAKTQEQASDSKMQKRGIGIAGAAASLLVGTVTGGIGLAAAGFAANEATDEVRQDADEIQMTAQQRRALMAGMFQAKGCHGNIDVLLKDPPRARRPFNGSPERVASAAIPPKNGDFNP